MKEKKNKGIQMPHTYVIIFFVVLFAAVLTYLIPAGMFETKEVTYEHSGAEESRTVLIPESFTTAEEGARQGTSLFEPGGG
ncbi:hypothetical protein LD39_05990, partial [Halobacillus sp. BBL2006]